MKRVIDHEKHNYIYILQARNRIKTYIIDGYKCYDENELAEYQKTAKRGRPIKQLTEVQEWNILILKH